MRLSTNVLALKILRDSPGSPIDHPVDLMVVEGATRPSRKPSVCERLRDPPQREPLPRQLSGEADDLVLLLVDVDPPVHDPEAERQVSADELADALHVPDGHGGPLGDNVALELCQDRQQPEQHLPGGGGGLDLFAEGDHVGAPPVQGLGDGDRVLG